MTFFEEKDDTGKSPQHKINALNAHRNKSDLSNAKVVRTTIYNGRKVYLDPVSLKTLMRETDGVIVGGYVRDMIRGVEPHDLDLASPMLPEDVLRKFQHSYELGFGTVAVHTTDQGHVEVTTFRSEGGGRKPTVKFVGDLKTDLSRRDFTFNAMALDQEGRLIDPFNGVQAIENKMVISVYEPVKMLDIDEGDPLRTVRAARFAHLFGYIIESSLEKAMMTANLSGLSGERIYTEVEKMFHPEVGVMDPASALIMLDHYNILEKTIPEVHELHKCKHNPEFHQEGDGFEHTVIVLDYVKNESMLTKMAAMLHDVGKACVWDGSTKYHGHAKEGVAVGRAVMKRLGRSKYEREGVAFVIENHMKMHVLNEMKPSKRRALYDSPYFPMLLKVAVADNLARGGGGFNVEEFVARDSTTRYYPTKPFVTGYDLMERGYSGPEIGVITKEIVTLQIEGRITTKAEALQYLDNL